jgi:hypothetical protein
LVGGGCVGPRAGLNVVCKKRENPHNCPWRVLNPCHPSRNLITILGELLQLLEQVIYCMRVLYITFLKNVSIVINLTDPCLLNALKVKFASIFCILLTFWGMAYQISNTGTFYDLPGIYPRKRKFFSSSTNLLVNEITASHKVTDADASP